ncbi:deoxynucleoside triphosphate triphosphohydrolase SAMHD1-like isoform X3 [Penaeus chinensis]|uniref:deoxynucleoside triphosphate triphosphohydrolase SAMHD1-like isoform X3 n=1 Tax=Penaeus chinensis TaxID=139456 RepID=UPI001FB7BFD7|nr:deoxynucleoside triphosphate triphosphohydrolase SAMHD1-like isoform X3 [Penaeus chinensis]
MDGGKIIKDAIHGHIEFPALCVRIIDTPQFQRLRFLKQLGTASFVYPAASHNRFEHCLGTCYLAGKMVNALRSRQEELGINETDVLCVQIAGLCHDLGHGAFSHVFETFMKESKESFEHEKMSCKMFDHLLRENNIMQDFENAGLGEKDVQFIKDLILGAKPSEEKNGRTAAKAFLFEIVNNRRTGADVDKWDYFLRDCHGLGINVTFEYERLIHFSRAAEVEGEWQIVFKEAEAENLYEMNHARTMLHKKAYQHRVVKIIDRMLVDALLKADDSITYKGENGQSFKLSKVCNDVAAYTYLTDDVMYRILRMPPGSSRLEEAKLILKNILARNLYSYVGEFSEADVNDLEKTKQTLKNRFGAECLEKKVKFGSKKGNPLEEQYFYRRGNEKFITLRAEQVSKMLPREFEDVKYYVITKDFRAEQDTPAKIKKIKEFLEEEKNGK